MIETLRQDLHYGFRMLRAQPGFTLAAVLALALGIGANSAIFSVVNAVLLRPLPFPQPDKIVRLWEKFQTPGFERMHVSVPEFIDYRDQNQGFDKIAAHFDADFSLTNTGEPERLRGMVASASLFPLLGVQPIFGRTFLAEEEQPGQNLVVILNHGLWQRRFGADPGIVGQKVILNGRTRTVVGVMPPGFRYPEECELWVPLALTPEMLNPSQRNSRFLHVIARLKPNVTLEQVQAEMEAVVSRFPNRGMGVSLIRLQDQLVGNLKAALLVLLGAVGFVLLISCANVANLMLARAVARQKETAIRLALGASRFRLLQQLLTESVLLALLGGLLGLLLAFWSKPVLLSVSPSTIPRAGEIGLDARVLGFTLMVSLLTGLGFGLVPALQSSKLNLNDSLKEGIKGSGGGGSRKALRNLFVISQIALALVLLVGAGLMIRSFSRLTSVNPGFNPEHVLTVDLALPFAKYGTDAQRAAFYQQLIQRLGTLPGVQAVGAVSALPLSGVNADRSFVHEGIAPENYDNRPPSADYRHSSPDYFRAMGIPLRAGRAFTEQDIQTSSKVAIVNETLVRRLWPNEEPIGKRVGFLSPQGMEGWLLVVGVVGDVKHHGLEEETRSEIYVPQFQTPASTVTLAVRAAADPLSLVAAVRNEVRAMDQDQPIYNIRTMEQLFARSIAERRFSMLLLGVFAAVALVLAAVGIYGTMAYTVTQRTHEIGIRRALGAQAGDVVKLIVRQGMTLTLIGVGIGLAASFALTRIIAGLLYGTTATDPLTFIAVSAVLVGVAFLACYFPARRASKVDPMIALRYE